MDNAERTLSIAAAILLFVVWLYLSRPTTTLSVKQGDTLLRYSVFLRVVAWVLALVPLTLLVWIMGTFRFQSPERAALVAGGLLSLSVLSGLLLLEAARVRIVLSKEGITSESPWRRVRTIPWNQVVDVSFSALNRWFIVRSVQGEVIRVSVFLNQLDEFIAKVKQHLPAERYTLATRGFKMM